MFSGGCGRCRYSATLHGDDGIRTETHKSLHNREWLVRTPALHAWRATRVKRIESLRSRRDCGARSVRRVCPHSIAAVRRGCVWAKVFELARRLYLRVPLGVQPWGSSTKCRPGGSGSDKNGPEIRTGPPKIRPEAAPQSSDSDEYRRRRRHTMPNVDSVASTPYSVSCVLEPPVGAPVALRGQPSHSEASRGGRRG